MPETLIIDTELGEIRQQKEDELARGIAQALAAGVRRRHQAGQPAMRDQHPRAHGCVHATFKVEEGLSLPLAQGVFVPGRTYPAWIRFSNGSSDPSKHDGEGDARGMAIKLLDVPGEKILAAERDAPTQDFILINNPTFLVDDPARYLRLVDAVDSNPVVKLVKLPLAVGLDGLRIAKAMKSSKIASPLEVRYWSAVPYRLGDPPHKHAVKYSARPSLPPGTNPKNPSPHFLRETMIRQLANGEAQFDFLVQRRIPSMDVENSRVEWDEARAPFVKVATITIPAQQFATRERDDFGENLCFSPWHALPQHRPLGAVNRARRIVYEEIGRLRHELNGTVQREPSA